MSTSEARDAARALFDALVGGALQSLKAAAPQLQGVRSDSPDLQARINAALPADASPIVGRFLAGLAGAGALGELSAVVREFERLAQQGGAQRLSGEVTSAVVLTDAQQSRIAADLRERYGEGLQVAFRVDETLIGGLIIRIGDQVLDNSLRTRMGSVQRTLAGG
ncbi:MAG: ATP synthase F1 subunit delta [Roseiflexaceae bacterium]